MSWLTTEEMAAARADLADLLDARCTIRRKGPDGQWGTIGHDIPCRVTMVGSGVEAGLSLAASDVDGNAVLTIPAGTSLGDETDVRGVLQALIAGDGNERPRRFEAAMVRPRQAFLLRIVGTVEG